MTKRKREEFLKNWKFDLQLLNEDDYVREENVVNHSKKRLKK